MKNRYILALLTCGVLLYYALPHLNLHGNDISAYFSWTWLTFFLMATAGNLAALLYSPVKKKRMAQSVPVKKMVKEKSYVRGQ